MRLLTEDAELFPKLREQYGLTPVFAKLPRDEVVERVIKRVENEESYKGACNFLCEPLWTVAKRRYSGHTATRVYALQRRHVYVVRKYNGKPNGENDTYWKVSSRGDTIEDKSRVLQKITKEDACELIKDVVKEEELMRLPVDPEHIPDYLCDF